MNSATESSFTPETRVGDIVAAHPTLARVFERVGIDYCCGGKKTLAQACTARGLDAATFATLLGAAGTATSRPEIDPAGLSLAQLADHIEQTHHAYLKAELPRLVELAGRVARKHGERDPRLAEAGETVRQIADEMFSHMQKEERILFPLVRQLEAGTPGGLPCGSIANPIRQMESEHDFVGKATARLRELTNGFQPDASACNTHRALLAGLAEFEADLHTHVHKENNILFPRALALETAVI
ncbi:MAG: iron-sulfur cluster repair di-iron protein [Opitutae bacterium]|nr:iron-sulfur cluster repair di-iron protein [Opitutae bacterium]